MHRSSLERFMQLKSPPHRSSKTAPHLHRLAAVLILAGATLTQAATVFTLDSAIQTALTNNPDARLAQHRIAAAQAGLVQANAAFWPQLQLRSSYAVTDNPMRVFGAALNQGAFDFALINDVPDTDNFNVHGLVVMPLYRGGQSTGRRDAARAGVEAARHVDLAVRQALAFEVSRTFHSIQKTLAFVEATTAATKAFEANLGIANTRLKAGTALKTEVLDVEVRLAEAREDLVRAQNAQALALRALKNLLAVQDPIEHLDFDLPDAQVPPPDTLPVRAELLSAQKQKEAAEAALRATRGGHLPTVNAFGRYDYDHGWRFNDGGDSYTAGVELQWNLWDGRLTHGRTREAQAAVEAAVENERKLQLAIELEVAQARLNIQEADQRLDVTGRATAQAKESAELTRSRFEQGLALATQLIDAETALTAARVRRAEAEADRRIAVASLRKALGLPQTTAFTP
jgi:outer membrane protein TolC